MTVDNNERYDVIGEVKARQLQDIEASRIKGIRGMREMKDILSRETMFLKKSDPQHCMVWERHVSADSEFGNKYPWNDKGEAEVPLSELDDFGLTKYMPMADLEPEVKTIDIEPKDKLLIVSDGVCNYAQTPEIEQIVGDHVNKEAGKTAEALVRFAKRYEAIPGPGGKSGQPQDDTTAVVVEIK